MAVTPQMLDAGYAAAEAVAREHGYGWQFDMLSESTVKDVLSSVYEKMHAAQAAPAFTVGNAAGAGSMPLVATDVPGDD
jgi:hypothetical protein